MNAKDIQQRFMYLFERVSEPLYFGPRGTDNFFYDVPVDHLCEKIRDASVQIRRTMGSGPANRITIRKPANIPNLTRVGSVCPRNSIFTYFLPSHRRAASELRDILNSQKTTDDLLNMACFCRDNENVNAQLFVHAMAGCILSRPDLKDFRMPPIWEIMPDNFLSSSITQQALTMARLPTEDRMILVVNRDTTGRDNNPENRLWYFREDIGANSHHWHWHIVYPFEFPVNSKRDRRGELFYYMHHEMISRYEAERLCNNLSRTKVIDIDEIVAEGYFPKLYSTNAGRNWGNRQEHTKLNDVERVDLDAQGLPDATRVTKEQLKKWRDRILEAIDTGMVLAKNSTTGKESRMPLKPFEGIDILGDMIESSSLNVNTQFYGDFHNMFHILLAYAHDPLKKHQESAGVMADNTGAMRDPVFYRLHKYIDKMFDQWKISLQPYPRTGKNPAEYPLQWEGITVSSISVKTGDLEPNLIVTYWMQSDINLARGLDFGRTTANNLGPIWARFTHLNHDDFTYNIKVQNANSKSLPATVRIYMAPRLDEHQDRFSMQDQRLLFFELDKFSVTLKPGENTISRTSLDSSVAIVWEESFAALERGSRAQTPTAGQGICGCGWPQHLLVPKGTPQGMAFDLVVFLTNGEEDKVDSKPTSGSTNTQQGKSCRDAMSYCGILNQKYPDSKPMGYPWDRNPYTVANPNNPNGTQLPTRNLDEFVKGVTNMSTIQVKIIHQPNRVEIRQGGAPADADMITELGVCIPQRGSSTPQKPKATSTSSANSSSRTPNSNGQQLPRRPIPGPTTTVTTPKTPNRGTWGQQGTPQNNPSWNRPGHNHGTGAWNNGNSRWGHQDDSHPDEWEYMDDHSHDAYDSDDH